MLTLKNLDPNQDEIVNICINPRGMCEPVEIDETEFNSEYPYESFKNSLPTTGTFLNVCSAEE